MAGFDVDIPDTAFDGPAETPEPVEAPAPVEAAAPEAPAPVETPAPEATEAPADNETFPRSYVEELRQESANYRTKAKELAAAFEGIDDADAAVFKSLMSMYREDPAAAAKEMQRLASGVLGIDAPADAPATPDLKGYMTEARFNELREQERLEAATRQIQSEAKSLGYELDTAKYDYLMSVARRNGGDLKAAHASIEAEAHAAIQKYVAAKEADAANSPTAPVDHGAPASGERQLKTWRDVEAAIDELF